MLIERWRTSVAQLKRKAAADRLGVSAATVSYWESGIRRIPHQRLREMDQVYNANGILIDLAHGIAVHSTMSGRKTWDYNPSPEADSVWAWIVSESGRPTSCRASQGYFCIPLTDVGAGTGTMLFFDAAVPNPAARVALDDPGWVTFGHGRPPPALGIPIINVRDTTWELVDQPLMRRTFNWLRSEPGQRALVKWLLTVGVQAAVVWSVYKGVEVDPVNDHPEVRRGAPAERGRRVSVAVVKALRTELGLSQRALAEAVTALMPEAPVTSVHIERLEAGRASSQPLIAERIDAVLGLDGSFGLAPVRIRPHRRGRTVSVEFPDFWVGPVWVEFLPQSQQIGTTYVLHWGPYSSRLSVQRGDIGYFRRSVRGQEPLRIQLPHTASSLRVGIGYHPDARDINHIGWDLGAGFLLNPEWRAAVHAVIKSR